MDNNLDMGKIGGRWKAPKSGRGFGYTSGKTYCKGVCSNFKNNPVATLPKYLNHVFCSRCGKVGVWMLKESVVNNRCPCCKMRVRTKNFKQ